MRTSTSVLFQSRVRDAHEGKAEMREAHSEQRSCGVKSRVRDAHKGKARDARGARDTPAKSQTTLGDQRNRVSALHECKHSDERPVREGEATRNFHPIHTLSHVSWNARQISWG